MNNFTVIQSQADLDHLTEAVTWEDASVRDWAITYHNQPYFPQAIIENLGQTNANFHLLYDVSMAPDTHLEVVLIGVNTVALNTTLHPAIQGIYQPNKGIDLTDHTQSTLQKCQGILYRFVNLTPAESLTYFSYPGRLTYPAQTNFQTNPLTLSNENEHLLFIQLNNTYQLSVSQNTTTATMHLTQSQMQALAHALLQAISNH